MTKKKELLLDQCHADFLDICFGNFPMDGIHTKVSRKIVGYGTNINEKIQSFDDFINLLTMQRKESEGIYMKFQFNDVSKTLMAEGNAAIFVDEIKLTMVIEGGNFELNVRITSIFEYADNQWWAVNFHGSVAHGVEGKQDTWTVNEWKEKNEKLEQIIAEKTAELTASIEELKAIQSQLVQQEKLASLGQLTAGIAHEIKNPLNFVNNFSELSLEMIDEAREEVRRVTEGSPLSRGESEGEAGARGVSSGAKNSDQPQHTDGNPSSANTPLNPLSRGETGSRPQMDLLLDILDDIETNLRTIHKHGSRADSIVKSMLQHSRGGDGKMEPTPLNPIIKEYVNLAFHGMRAGKDPINVDIDLQLDDNVGEVPIIAEDFSRVILNLCNNAFDAMREKLAVDSGQLTKSLLEGSDDPENLRESRGVSSSLSYHPKLTVRTKSDNGKVTIEIEDNGPGIPDEIKDKILQPFFTTKKGTQGTGLGLSITNDIIKAHGGILAIESANDTGTICSITLKMEN